LWWGFHLFVGGGDRAVCKQLLIDPGFTAKWLMKQSGEFSTGDVQALNLFRTPFPPSSFLSTL